MRRVAIRSAVVLIVPALLLSGRALAADGPVEAARPQAAAKPAEPAKPSRVNWAQIDIKGAYPEEAPSPSLFGAATESLSEALGRLDKAAEDGDLSGVILRIDSPSIGWAKLNDLRQAIGRVREKGKKVYARLDSASAMDYMLASACDEIIMPESGALMLVGLRAEIEFYKNLLDKFDVKADMLRVGEYKSAAEPFTRTDMSEPFRREMNEILDDYYRQMVETIAESRKLDPEQVRAAIDSGPHTARTAKELGLVDRLAYADEIDSLLKNGRKDLTVKIAEKYGKKKVDTDFSGFTGFMKMMNLMMGAESSKRASSGAKIAVIHATGAIMTGKSQKSLFGGEVLGSDTFVKAVEKAKDDKNVKAIVVRVNSPGGSALASDLMWRALEKAGKPVVVSMGDVAASGGYYISMGADCVFAEPGTLTGSIGVVGGKFALKGLWDKAGINTVVLSRGKNSGVLSSLEPFSESERKTMQKMLDDIYEQFTRKAAEGRKMEYEKLEELARGRVYTGAMAVKIGLVDKLGTLEDAVTHAKTLAGLKPDEKIERLLLPKPANPFEALFGSADAEAEAGLLEGRLAGELLGGLSPELVGKLRAAQLVNLLSREPRLTLMPFRLTVR